MMPASSGCPQHNASIMPSLRPALLSGRTIAVLLVGFYHLTGRSPEPAIYLFLNLLFVW